MIIIFTIAAFTTLLWKAVHSKMDEFFFFGGGGWSRPFVTSPRYEGATPGPLVHNWPSEDADGVPCLCSRTLANKKATPVFTQCQPSPNYCGGE